jgi:uncharacterized protein
MIYVLSNERRGRILELDSAHRSTCGHCLVGAIPCERRVPKMGGGAREFRDVDVVEINDYLGDHYDPTQKRLCLSTNVFNTPSVAALGIAAHETGHAIQHAKAYAPLKARMAIIPVTSIASRMLPFVIIGGFFFHITGLITLGIYCYLILLVFQLITLPVEFDASRRAKIILQHMGIVQPGTEMAGVNNVLNAAALTYVAAFVATLGNLLYLLSVRDRR